MALELPTRGRRLRRLGAVGGAILAYVAATFAVAWRYADIEPAALATRSLVRDGDFWRDGDRFLVKAVGYDPTRPGELPWARQHSAQRLDGDLARIRAAGFNAVRVWEALSPEELAIADRHGLAVIQGIWTDPEGDFTDPSFRAAAAERAGDVARKSRDNHAVLAYLVMNEPRPDAVRRAGVQTTQRLLRELAQAVRANDPGIPVGFASWPGLEFLDEPSLDFVAANLYPFRPSALVDAVGYDGMVRLWKRKIAGQRPLLVSEYGLSVSPGTPKPDAPGGRTEAEQAEGLPDLAEATLRGGAAGNALFMWIDGWWKNNEAAGDEQSHDPDDGEEWFGLYAMDAATDTVGRARPALAAMEAHNGAVMAQPADGAVVGEEVEVAIWIERPEAGTRLTLAIDDHPAMVVPVVREGPWLRGRAGLMAEGIGAQHLRFTLRGGGGERSFERTLWSTGHAPAIALSRDGGAVVARATRGGDVLPGATVRFSVSEPTRRFDRRADIVADEAGVARLELQPWPDTPVLVAAAVGGANVAVDWITVAADAAAAGQD